jgi:hypothetical protein
MGAGAPQAPVADQAALPSFTPELASGTGSTLAGRGIPNMIGDFFGSSGSVVGVVPRTVSFSYTGTGTVITTFIAGGDPNASLVFDVPPISIVNNSADLFSVGQGSDTDGNGFADTFAIAEPIPPTDAATSPGSTFAFDGGTAANPTGTYQDGDDWLINYSFTEFIQVELPLQPGGGGVHVGRTKIAENSSPIPRRRIFLNYSLFDDVPLTRRRVTVNRFSPGFEHTFLCNQMSFELRAPFAGTIDTQLNAEGSQVHSVEFGDLFLSLKALLLRSEMLALAAGVSVSVPTADDTTVSLASGRELLRIENEVVHLMPYIGWLLEPNSRWFTHGFLQLDTDIEGNSIVFNPTGNRPVMLGKLRDTAFLYSDVGIGYRWYENPQACQLLAIIPTVEWHYNRSLEPAKILDTGRLRIGQPREDIQVLNMVLASTFQFRNNRSLSIGYATPIGNSSDRQFDGELRVIWNRFF